MPMTRRTVLLGASAAGLAACAAAAPKPPEKPRPLRLLVLGGTRFLGPALVEEALRRGHTLTLFNRGKSGPERFASTPGVTHLRGNRDPKLDEGLKALASGTWDAVLDTSGYVPRIVKASAELLAPRVRQYVFVSTISVFADRSVPCDESAPVATLTDPTTEEVMGNGGANYGALKALCEQAAEAALPGRTLNVRPGLIVGPLDGTDRFTYWPVRLARGGEVLAPGDGEDHVQFIDVRDLAEWTLSAVERNLAGVYNATGPAGPLTMRRFLEETAAAVGPAARLTWVPTPFLEEHAVSPWSDMPVWVPNPEGKPPGSRRVVVQKAVDAGLRFRSVADTARATLAYFRTLPPERQEALKAGLPAAREQEVLAAWHAKQAAGTAAP